MTKRDPQWERRLDAQFRKTRTIEYRGLEFPTPNEATPDELKKVAETYSELEATDRRLMTIAKEGARTGKMPSTYQPDDLELARAVYLLASRHTEDEQEVGALLTMFALYNEYDDDPERARRTPLAIARDMVTTQDPKRHLRLAWLGRWRALSYPAIRLTTQEVRSFVHEDTRASTEVNAPWRAFVLLLPEDALPSLRQGGRCITQVGVHAHRSYEAEGASWYIRDRLGSYLELHDESITNLPTPHSLNKAEGEARELVVEVGRLIVGACLAASVPDALVRVKRPPVKWRLSKDLPLLEHVFHPR